MGTSLATEPGSPPLIRCPPRQLVGDKSSHTQNQPRDSLATPEPQAAFLVGSVELALGDGTASMQPTTTRQLAPDASPIVTHGHARVLDHVDCSVDGSSFELALDDCMGRSHAHSKIPGPGDELFLVSLSPVAATPQPPSPAGHTAGAPSHDAAHGT